MSNLVDHAQRELEMQGMFSGKGDFYDGMTGNAVMELMEIFARQGHSGMSAGIAIALFTKLARFEPLSPPTNNPDEWIEVGDKLWQCTRQPSAFSKDWGKTYYRVDEQYKWRKVLPWALYSRLPYTWKQPMHTAKEFK
jgi:hypothetical protein